ncbi:unannotated protein [freshwater metagenome]|uniref:Unannotated protein n=1 Tax=freshwater metagenome TaxID=449393 RepID=A0A6J6F681_9ZZZZ
MLADHHGHGTRDRREAGTVGLGREQLDAERLHRPRVERRAALLLELLPLGRCALGDQRVLRILHRAEVRQSSGGVVAGEEPLEHRRPRRVVRPERPTARVHQDQRANEIRSGQRDGDAHRPAHRVAEQVDRAADLLGDQRHEVGGEPVDRVAVEPTELRGGTVAPVVDHHHLPRSREVLDVQREVVRRAREPMAQHQRHPVRTRADAIPRQLHPVDREGPPQRRQHHHTVGEPIERGALLGMRPGLVEPSAAATRVLGATLRRTPWRSEITGTRDIRSQFLGAGESSPTQVSRRSWHPEHSAAGRAELPIGTRSRRGRTTRP